MNFIMITNTRLITNIIILFIFLFSSSYLIAQTVGTVTGFPIPRFVSLKSDESNLRVGASKDYPIYLTYNIRNLPLEIIDEYEDWRRVVDIEENEGWIHKSIIKGNRYGIINTLHSQSAQIYNKPEGILVGKIGNNNIVKINQCLSLWCHIKIEQNKGWINKVNLWGVYNNEKFNIPFYQPIINLYWKIKYF